MKNHYFSYIWIAIVAAITFVLFERLPEQMPIHFNIHGEADRFTDRAHFSLLLPAIMLIMTLLLPILVRLELSDNDSETNKNILGKLILALNGILGIIHISVIIGALQSNFGLTITLIQLSFGMFFLILGKNISHLKPSFFIGIRTPWTLSNKENWDKTHHFAGKLFFNGGLLVLVQALILKSMPISFAIIITIAILPIAYSYWLSSRIR